MSLRATSYELPDYLPNLIPRPKGSRVDIAALFGSEKSFRVESVASLGRWVTCISPRPQGGYASLGRGVTRDLDCLVTPLLSMAKGVPTLR